MGSNTIKAVALGDGRDVLGFHVEKTSHDIDAVTTSVVDKVMSEAGAALGDCAFIVATGYGRVTCTLASKDVSEITCHARGAHFRMPGTRTVIDIGGQDSKVITLADNGRAIDFVMNDKCAAGTGRFLEVMAQALGVPLGDFTEISRQSINPVNISNTCTVFAESEVISLLHAKTPKEDISRAVHDAIASRITSMVRKVGFQKDVVLIGGMAKNPGFVDAMKRSLESEVLVPDGPEFIGALGAALLAADRVEERT